MMKNSVALVLIAAILPFAAVCRGDTPSFERIYDGSALRGPFVGLSALYITGRDWDDGYGGALRLGYQFGGVEAFSLRHGPFVESGFFDLKTRLDEGRVDFDVIPLTANYQASAEVVDFVWLYLGGGGGVGFADLSLRDGGSGSDQPLMGQVFIGVEGMVGEWASLRGGFRQVWVEGMEFGDLRVSGEDASVFELGVNFWF